MSSPANFWQARYFDGLIRGPLCLKVVHAYVIHPLVSCSSPPRLREVSTSCLPSPSIFQSPATTQFLISSRNFIFAIVHRLPSSYAHIKRLRALRTPGNRERENPRSSACGNSNRSRPKLPGWLRCEPATGRSNSPTQRSNHAGRGGITSEEGYSLKTWDGSWNRSTVPPKLGRKSKLTAGCGSSA